MKLAARHQAFADLHRGGTFVMPNPWCAGSARMMAAAGARALATSSAAHAFTLGREDGRVSRDEALAHAALILGATDLPLSGDFENGFAEAPEGVAETLRLAAEVGLSGLSIEDVAPPPGRGAYAFDLAVERIAAAASAARALGRPFQLCARADGVMTGAYDLAEGIARLRAFEAAGADVLFLPLPPDAAALGQVVAAVQRPVNAMAAGPLAALSLAEMAALGVRRISTGPMLARLAQTALHEGLEAIFGAGHFTPFAKALPGSVVTAALRAGAGRG